MGVYLGDTTLVNGGGGGRKFCCGAMTTSYCTSCSSCKPEFVAPYTGLLGVCVWFSNCSSSNRTQGVYFRNIIRQGLVADVYSRHVTGCGEFCFTDMVPITQGCCYCFYYSGCNNCGYIKTTRCGYIME